MTYATAAINTGYNFYLARFEIRDHFDRVIDTTIEVICQGEEFALGAYGWMRDTTWEDAWAISVTGFSWLVAAYLYVVLNYATQVWKCWERYQSDTAERFLSVEALSDCDLLLDIGFGFWESICIEDAWFYARVGFCAAIDGLFCLNNELNYGG